LDFVKVEYETPTTVRPFIKVCAPIPCKAAPNAWAKQMEHAEAEEPRDATQDSASSLAGRRRSVMGYYSRISWRICIATRVKISQTGNSWGER